MLFHTGAKLLIAGGAPHTTPLYLEQPTYSGSFHAKYHVDQHKTAKMRNIADNGEILNFRGSCSHPPLPMAKFGLPEWTHGLSYHTKFHLDLFILSPVRSKKWDFDWMLKFQGGGTCTQPLDRLELNLACQRRPTVKSYSLHFLCQISSWSVHDGENPQF